MEAQVLATSADYFNKTSTRVKLASFSGYSIPSWNSTLSAMPPFAAATALQKLINMHVTFDLSI